jgi:hypothetical protein
MRSDATMVRREDGKRFRVIALGHWSVIREDAGTEVDVVKWYGDDRGVALYVGDSGNSYKLEENPARESSPEATPKVA